MSCPNRTTCELWGQVGRFTACSAVATYSHVLHALAQHRGQKAGSWGLASASAAFNLPRPTALLCCLWPNWPAKLENPFFRWREASTRCSVNISNAVNTVSAQELEDDCTDGRKARPRRRLNVFMQPWGQLCNSFDSKLRKLVQLILCDVLYATGAAKRCLCGWQTQEYSCLLTIAYSRCSMLSKGRGCGLHLRRQCWRRKKSQSEEPKPQNIIQAGLASTAKATRSPVV
jgi:hypothetical protein